LLNSNIIFLSSQASNLKINQQFCKKLVKIIVVFSLAGNYQPTNNHQLNYYHSVTQGLHRVTQCKSSQPASSAFYSNSRTTPSCHSEQMRGISLSRGHRRS